MHRETAEQSEIQSNCQGILGGTGWDRQIYLEIFEKLSETEDVRIQPKLSLFPRAL